MCKSQYLLTQSHLSNLIKINLLLSLLPIPSFDLFSPAPRDAVLSSNGLRQEGFRFNSQLVLSWSSSVHPVFVYSSFPQGVPATSHRPQICSADWLIKLIYRRCEFAWLFVSECSVMTWWLVSSAPRLCLMIAGIAPRIAACRTSSNRKLMNV